MMAGRNTRNSQTWIQASLDLPGPGFGMCGGDRWRYVQDASPRLD